VDDPAWLAMVAVGVMDVDRMGCGVLDGRIGEGSRLLRWSTADAAAGGISSTAAKESPQAVRAPKISVIKRYTVTRCLKVF